MNYIDKKIILDKVDSATQEIKLEQVCMFLNDIHTRPEKIIDYVEKEITENGYLIGNISFIDYLINKLPNCDKLSIWGRGNKLLDLHRDKNIFQLLKKLRQKLEDQSPKDSYLRPEPIQDSNLNDSTEKERQIPDELNTEKGRKLLKLVIDKGLADEQYHWRESKNLLAYFAEKASKFLGLSKAHYGDKDKVSWKPFESLFLIQKDGQWHKPKNLASTRNDYNKYGREPKNHEVIDELFNDLA